MIFWLCSSFFFFFNIMFLNKVSGYSREAAQGRSLGSATTWDLINQINNEAGEGKQRAHYRPSCLFVFPLRHCSYKQWAHSKGFKNIPGGSVYLHKPVSLTLSSTCKHQSLESHFACIGNGKPLISRFRDGGKKKKRKKTLTQITQECHW